MAGWGTGACVFCAGSQKSRGDKGLLKGKLQQRRSKRHTVCFKGEEQETLETVGLQPNTGYPKSALRVVLRPRAGNGADKGQPWLAARLKAPALRGKKRLSSRCPSFPAFTTVALETWTKLCGIMLPKYHCLLSETNRAVPGSKQFVAGPGSRGDHCW